MSPETFDPFAFFLLYIISTFLVIRTPTQKLHILEHLVFNISWNNSLFLLFRLHRRFFVVGFSELIFHSIFQGLQTETFGVYNFHLSGFATRA